MPIKPQQERKATKKRRQSIIAAAIKCLKSDGLEGTSVRKISAEAGISIGLINHHFNSKEDLIAEAYGSLADQTLQNSLQGVIMDGGKNPRKQMSRFLHNVFHRSEASELKAWISFWRMAEQSPKILAVHDRTNRDFHITLEKLLISMCKGTEVTSFNLRLATLGLSALIDGLWLEYCLNPKNFSPSDGIQLCETWVDGLFSGAFQIVEN